MFLKVFMGFALMMSLSQSAFALMAESVAGTYKAVLYHDETDYFQYALITLRTTNPQGELKIAANVRVIFGEQNSNEYLTYEFPDVPLNILTSQLSIKADDNDVSMIGTLRDGTIQGEWFSTLVGFVGNFEASKEEFPEVAEEKILVEALSGHYRGSITNRNPESHLPEKVTFSFVTTQENSSGVPTLHISGNSRFYLGEFGSTEYVEIKFSDIQFNFYNRFLTAKTEQYGLTFKGYLGIDGNFQGTLYSDAVGLVGPANLNRHGL